MVAARLPLVLASASPRRLALLRSIGLDPIAAPTGVDETVLSGEPPEAHVRRLARAKAARARGALRAEGRPAVVLGADTVVVVDGSVLGKPNDADEATAMLRRLSGRDHEVLTAVHVLRTDDDRSGEALCVSRVRFRRCSDDWIAWYVATGEPMDKAGAYGIQERGVLLTSRIEGSWSNVVGLPLEALPELFAAVGFWCGTPGG